MTLKIHAFPLSPRGFKALVVANHVGADYEFCFLDLTKGAQAAPEYAALNPNKKMPTLESGDFALWESNAIISYLAATHPNAGLLPSNERERADVTRWLFWDLSTWDPACATLIFENFVKGLFRGEGPDSAEVQKGMDKFNFAAAILDAQLKGKRFLRGNDLCVADFALAAPLIAAQQAKFPLEAYPEIRRWAAAMADLPAWRKTLAMQAQSAAA